MSLDEAVYNVTTRTGFLFGRLPEEDQSTEPIKQVYLVRSFRYSTTIHVIPCGGNKYMLKERGAVIGLDPRSDKQELCASYFTQDVDPVWELTKEEDGWTISMNGKSVGMGDPGAMNQFKAVLGSEAPAYFIFEKVNIN